MKVFLWTIRVEIEVDLAKLDLMECIVGGDPIGKVVVLELGTVLEPVMNGSQMAKLRVGPVAVCFRVALGVHRGFCEILHFF